MEGVRARGYEECLTDRYTEETWNEPGHGRSKQKGAPNSHIQQSGIEVFFPDGFFAIAFALATIG